MGLTAIIKTQLMQGFTIGIAAGIIAALLAVVLGMLPTDALSQIAINLGLLVLLIVIAAKTKLAGLTLYKFVILGSSIGIVGSIINLLLPAAGQFILSGIEFTISGLLMTMIYIGLGIFALRKVGINA
ncbi:MAG: hypothetical protein ACYS1A_19705 [Planctomycetota bacterium]|jgi:hypothetical protein